MGDRFFPRLWQGTAPLLLWAAHFFFCYLYSAAAGCSGTTHAVLLGATVAALLAGAWLLKDACVLREGKRRHGLLDMARIGTAVLALAGIAWGTLPLLIFGDCR